MKVVSQYSDYEKCLSGCEIFKEGNTAEELYIIKHGEVVIKKSLEANKEIDLAKFIDGECFGEMDLLDNSPRDARAIAEKETILLRFPKKGIFFKNIISEHPDIFASILSKLLAQIAGRIRSTNRLISEKAPWIQNLKKQLLSDKLTGLYNRAFIEEDFYNNISDYGDKFCIVMVKPDKFKYINDTYGHEAGDATIRLMADTLKKTVREQDTPVRYRSNEFTSIMPDSTLQDAIDFSKKMLDNVRLLDISQMTNNDPFKLTASIGISIYPCESKKADELIKLAYDRLYKAWEEGGDKIIHE
ncbi:MAG: GGDEF domain-containing protein [Parachlamydiales bacterium]|nr:GGDEF domain-containing protein [Parachlamydiales bacterium]